MTRVRVGVLSVLALLAGASSVHAQAAQEGWQVSVDFLIIATRGNDVHVGDVFTESLRATGTIAQATIDYGVTYDPIVTRMKTDQSVLIDAAYRGARWGGGVRGWRVLTDAGTVEGSATSPAPTSTTESTRGIRFWDHSLLPVTNLQQASGISPVGYHAQNSLENLRIEAYVERRWNPSSDIHLATRFGVAHARLENTRSEGQTMNTFIVDTIGGSTTTTRNNIAIDSESELTANLTGPLVALGGDSTFRRVKVDWLVTQATLIGTADTSGEWTDIDDITDVTVSGSLTSTARTLLRGSLPVSRDVRGLVPTLDLQVKVSMRATRMVSVGAGFFSSTWFGMPMAPAFSVPGEWTDISGTGWRDQTRDVTFQAFSVFVGFGF